MLHSARYKAAPYPSDTRRHQIPAEVFNAFFGSPDPRQLDGVDCLLEVLVVMPGSSTPVVLPPVIHRVSSAGEPRLGKRVCAEYPEPMPPGAYLLVQLTPLT